MGAIVLSEQPLPKPPSAAAKAAYLQHVLREGFGPTGLADTVAIYVARVSALRALFGPPWPEISAASLQASVESWLGDTLSDTDFKLPNPKSILGGPCRTIGLAFAEDARRLCASFH